MSKNGKRSSNPAIPKMMLYIPEDVKKLMNMEKAKSGLRCPR
jgi:hypothetical protein